MHIVLFIVYYGLACYGIWMIPFFQKSGIKPGILLLLFGLHVGVGCIHNVIAYRFYPAHGDIWNFYETSLQYRALLLHDSHAILNTDFTWNDFSHNGIIWIDLFLNLFSFENLYIDTLLFSFPVFLGTIALYRVFRRCFPANPLTAFTTLLLPSTLFWTSCVHREGMLYLLLGFLLFWLERLFTRDSNSRWNRWQGWFSVLFLILITYHRISVAIALVPALLAWWLMQRPGWPMQKPRSLVQKHHSRKKGLLIAGCLSLSFLVLILVRPGFFHSLLQGIAAWQHEFQLLEGHSRLYLPVLDGSFSNFWHALPFAVRNGFFEPLPGAGGRPIYLIFSVELMVIWGIAAFAFLRWFYRFSSRKAVDPPHNFLYFNLLCFVFCLIGLLEIGYIVPFAGAIVRYRSIYLPFLLAPFFHSLCGLPAIRRLNDGLASLMLNELPA